MKWSLRWRVTPSLLPVDARLSQEAAIWPPPSLPPYVLPLAKEDYV